MYIIYIYFYIYLNLHVYVRRLYLYYYIVSMCVILYMNTSAARIYYICVYLR